MELDSKKSSSAMEFEITFRQTIGFLCRNELRKAFWMILGASQLLYIVYFIAAIIDYDYTNKISDAPPVSFLVLYWIIFILGATIMVGIGSFFILRKYIRKFGSSVHMKFNNLGFSYETDYFTSFIKWTYVVRIERTSKALVIRLPSEPRYIPLVSFSVAQLTFIEESVRNSQQAI